jgi:hypothetical protein
MTDIPPQASPAPVPPSDHAVAPEGWTPGPILEVIADNFAAISASALIGAVLCSTIFVTGYLTPFDPRLIWFIEYSDIIKFGLVVVSVVASVSFTIPSLVLLFAGTDGSPMRRQWLPLVLLPITILVVAIFAIVTELFDSYWYAIMSSAFFVTGIYAMITNISRLLTSELDFEKLLHFTTSCLVGALVIGIAYGTFVQHSKDGDHYDVFLKDRDIANVRLVMVTSHHTIFYTGHITMVIPTADVVRFISR